MVVSGKSHSSLYEGLKDIKSLLTLKRLPVWRINTRVMNEQKIVALLNYKRQ